MLAQVAGLPAQDLEQHWTAQPTSADLAWAVGRLRLAQGGDAAAPLRAAADHDGLPFRATSAVNQVIREVAQARGTVLVDAEAAIQADGPVPGDELFFDWVHPRREASRRLAGALIAGLVQADLVKALPSGPVAGPELTAAELLGAELRVARGWLQWACVRQHDPYHRLAAARRHASAVLALDPDHAEARAILVVADMLEGLSEGPPPQDPAVRAQLGRLHPTLAAMLGT